MREARGRFARGLRSLCGPSAHSCSARRSAPHASFSARPLCPRSNPGTPTQPRRPDFIGVGGLAGGPPYYDFQHGPGGAHQVAHPGAHHGGGVGGRGAAGAPGAYGSPQRRFLSEGELVRGGPSAGELAYSRTNNTVDNIRELAGSPQRGVYMWKDTSPGAYAGSGPGGGPGGNGVAPPPPPHHHVPHGLPGPHARAAYDYYRSNPTSPTQQAQAAHAPGPHALYGQRPPPGAAQGYGYPPVRGGVPVYPPPQSPQIKRKTMATPTTPTAMAAAAAAAASCGPGGGGPGPGGGGGPVGDGRRPSPGSRRPMSFVRALEMSDSMELTAAAVAAAASPGTPRAEHRLAAMDAHRSATPTPDRASVYDMNYEISV